MTLLATQDDISFFSAWAAWAQVIVATGALIMLLGTFKLQARIFSDQLKVSTAQLKLLGIETMRHRREIMPQFTMDYYKEPYTLPSTPEGKYLCEISLDLNDNPVRDLSIEITETVNFELYNIYNNNFPKGNFNAKWRCPLQLIFSSTDGTIPARGGYQSHIIFKLLYKDIKGNQYEQTTVFVPHLSQKTFSNEPLLIKAVDL